MGEISLFRIAGIAGLDEEAALIEALGELARDWSTLADEIDGAGSAIALLRAIADGTEDPSVTAAFKKIGAEALLTKLQGEASRLKVLLDEIPDSVVRLLEPIGSFDESGGEGSDRGLISWPLLDRPVSASAPPTAVPGAKPQPSYELSFGAKAALTLEAGDSWPYKDPMPSGLLRFRADGGLKASGGATLPFSVGQIGVSASAGANVALEYYFAPADQTSLYALAVADRIGKLVNPFDFDSVWNGFARSDLVGLHYQHDGSAALNVSVSIADTAALAAAIKADLAATISVGFKLDGRFFLTLRSDGHSINGSPRIVATLSREWTRGADFGLKLGVTVDLSSVAQQVHKVLNGALGEWDKVLKEVTPYLSPGTWLRGKAVDVIKGEADRLVEDDDLRDALAHDLQGLIGVGTPEKSQIASWLTGQLTGALDAARGWADKQGASAVDSLLDNLGSGLPALARPDIRAKLKGAAEKLVADAAKDLEEKTTGLYQADADKLGKALRKVGVTVDAKLKSADDALAGVRALIERYNALFRKVVAATQDAARAKLSAAVQIEEGRLDRAMIEVKGTLVDDGPEARAAFRALTQGDFNSLVRLFDGAGGGGFALDIGASALGRYSSSRSKVGLELVLFGFGATGSELLTAEAGVVVDGTGKVQVDTRANLKRRFKGLDAEREIELISSFSLVAARALAVAPPTVDRRIGLALTIGHVDDGLKRHEVERFVRSLVDAGLYDRTALDLAGGTFTRWIGSPGSNGKVAGAILLKLALDRPSLSRLLGLDKPALSDPQLRRIASESFGQLRVAASGDAAAAIDETIAFLHARRPARSLEDLLMDPRGTRRALVENITGSNIARLPDRAIPFMDAVELAAGMRTMVEQLRLIYFSDPEPLGGDDDPATWRARDYRDAEREAAGAVRGWLQLNNVLLWTNSSVHPRTIAFLKTMIALAGLGGNAFSLTITRREPGVSPETVVLPQTRIE